MQTFRPRFLSAVVFGAIMLLGLLGDKFLYISLFTVVVFIGAKELYNIIQKNNDRPVADTTQLIYALACVALFLFVAHATGFQFIQNVTLLPLIYLSMFILLIVFTITMHGFKNNFAQLLLGCLYVPLTMGLLAQCYAINTYYPVALIALIWINDTMQYVVGSIIGKHKMAPVISPKKTWEGTIGGSALCLIVAVVLSIFNKNFTTLQWISMGLIASVGGTFGDLLESKLKRSAGIKDSGNIMPGHGGVLDRFDSLFLASLLLWLVVFITKS